MENTPLTPNQEKVLAFIAAGYSATAAAQQAGVHRNTVSNWLKVEAFRKGLEQARLEKQILFWDQAAAMAAECLNNLRIVANDPTALPSLRFRATKTILDHVTQYLPGDSALLLPDPPEILVAPHNSAQPPQPEPTQIPYRKPPTPGRNDLCPCGSGIKFKHCCLNKPTPPRVNTPAA
ncbi:MAG: SEC-C metal-binding domain-containing protein [Bryobacteraceae bacterium]|jgi:SEC-C motif-containing protein